MTSSLPCFCTFAILLSLHLVTLLLVIISHVLPLTGILCANNLSSPDNGTVTLDASTFGSQANYSCSEGYTLNGTTTLTRVCQADGQWSGSEPTCEGQPVTYILIAGIL